jgi:dihydrofolate reductase
MGKLIFAMSQSLDGYVSASDGSLLPPDLALFRHFVEYERSLAGVLYGRRIYEVMRYWDEDHDDWEERHRDFAAAWRAHPKWVVSHSLKSVGPNATLVDGDVDAFVRKLKTDVDGDITVAGPDLASSLSKLGLIDEYRLYFRPAVLGSGKPYFTGAAPPPLRLVGVDRVGDDAVRLIYERE